MDSKQEAKLSMYDAVLTHCNDNTAIVATVPAFQSSVGSFQDTYEDLQAAAQEEIQAIAGVTVDKAAQRKTLVDLATDISAAIFAFASATNNFILKEQVNLSFSDFNRLKDELLTPACQNVLAAANDNSAALIAYGVTAVKITTFSTAIDDYATAVPGPRNAVSHRSSVSTTIKNLFKTGDEILKEQMDKLVIQFKAGNLGFYNAYKNNRIIIDAGTSTTKAEGTITDSVTGDPLSGVIITVDGQVFTATSRPDGAYSLVVPVPGTYTVIFTRAEYQTKQITNVVITLGQTTNLDVQLVSIPV